MGPVISPLKGKERKKEGRMGKGKQKEKIHNSRGKKKRD
jgi:hypothetical protein